jgi:hypothetical protein
MTRPGLAALSDSPNQLLSCFMIDVTEFIGSVSVILCIGSLVAEGDPRNHPKQFFNRQQVQFGLGIVILETLL